MTLPYDFIDERLHERRERVFLVLAGLFVGAMAMLNVIGLTRFVRLAEIDLGGFGFTFAVAVGVLPYPLTFLCTDLISELYGRRRANFVVWVGLVVNLLVIGTMWLGNALPPVAVQPDWQTLHLAEEIRLATGEVAVGEVELFHIMFTCTAGAVFASMIAYITAQFCDVALFHFWKKLTRGRHLWLRNNASTLVSQFVDSVMVISITFGALLLAGEMAVGTFLEYVGSNYLFKFAAALLDTIPLYLLVRWLSRWLRIDPNREHAGWDAAK
jgi:hypothetical protein